MRKWLKQFIELEPIERLQFIAIFYLAVMIVVPPFAMIIILFARALGI